MNLVESINNYLAKQPIEEPRRYFGASSIGKPCLRSIWYAYKGVDSLPIEPKTQVTFNIGKCLEEMVLEYLKQSGVFVISQGQFYQDSDVMELQGHVDGVIVLPDGSKAILELKTANDTSFNRFKSHGLLPWSEVYYSQLQTYMGMSGIHKGVLLALNKNTSEFHQECVIFDEIWYESLKWKAKNLRDAIEPPEKISGNGSYFLCKSCQFRKVCHE